MPKYFQRITPYTRVSPVHLMLIVYSLIVFLLSSPYPYNIISLQVGLFIRQGKIFTSYPNNYSVRQPPAANLKHLCAVNLIRVSRVVSDCGGGPTPIVRINRYFIMWSENMNKIMKTNRVRIKNNGLFWFSLSSVE